MTASTSEKQPTFIHYLPPDSIYARVGFVPKFLVFVLIGTFGILNTNYVWNVAVGTVVILFLLSTGLHRHNRAPFLLLGFAVTVLSLSWLLFSRVSGDIVYVTYPWGTYVTNETFHAMASASSRWGLVICSGILFLTITSESELLAVLNDDRIPDGVALPITIAFNTLTFAIEDLPLVNYSLTARGHPTSGMRNHVLRIFYLGFVFLLTNFQRVETLNQSHLIRSRVADDSSFQRLSVTINELGYVPEPKNADDQQREAIVEDIEFSMNRGDVLGIIGNTGSGKTTILKVLGGVISETGSVQYSGSVRFDGEEIDPETLRKSVAFAFQEPENQFIHRTVDQELRSYAGIDPDVTRTYAERFGILDLLDKSVEDISTGERKLVSMIAGFAANTDLLVLDEPTANLDPERARTVFELIEEQSEDRFIVVSTHDTEKVPVDLFDAVLWYDGDDWDHENDVDGARLSRAYDFDVGPAEYRPGSPPIISFEGVEYAYPDGSTGIEEVSFSIAPGEIVAITGANGSGKTTVTELIMGIRSPSEGTVTVSADSGQIGLVRQEPGKQLFTGSVTNEVTFASDEPAVDETELLRDVSLYDHRDDHPFFLSRGQKQMTLLSAVFLQQPACIIVDEPFTGLDESAIENVLEYLCAIYEDYRPTIILTEQNAEPYESLLSREIRLQNGTVETDRTL